MKIDEVIVYVEGPSDKFAMEKLLNPLITKKKMEGILIQFFEAPEGDKKESVLMKVPLRALNILRNKPNSMVIAMPDLYPRNKGFPHQTFNELRDGVLDQFNEALKRKGLIDDERLKARFQVFCFKYDLEALILASKEKLEDRLETKNLAITWRIPVEDQNHDNPPKYIVKSLFEQHGKSYRETVDAPVILGAMNYIDIVNQCQQCFKPFVDFLTELKG